jgi:hypothetical protein
MLFGGDYRRSFYTLLSEMSAIRRNKQQTFNIAIIRRDSSGDNVACVCDKPSVEAENFLKSVSHTTFYE